MPVVEVNGQEIDFPDTMSQEEIRGVLQEKFPPTNQTPTTVAAKPYLPMPAEDGQDEDVLFQSTGEVVKMPAGSSQILSDLLSDDTYDTPVGEPSSALEEAAAVSEAQLAHMALLYSAFGLLEDERAAAEFIADRRKALVSAQARQPENVKKFREDFEKAEGFFGTAGVILSNPKAVGRDIITNAPNAVVPLISGYAGMMGGAAVGGPVGGVVGLGGGSFVGSTVAEAGAALDGYMQDDGIDTSDAAAVFAALQDDNYMNGLRNRAAKRGLSVAAVDALFAVTGGALFKKIAKGSTLTKKAIRGAGETGYQAVGETAGELAGQVGGEEKISPKDAIYEGVTSIGQATGQAGLAVTAKKGLQTVVPERKPVPVPEVPDVPNIDADIDDATAAQTQAEKLAAAIKERIATVPADEAKIAVENFMAGREVDVSAFDDAKKKAMQEILDTAKPVRETMVRGRVEKLDADIENVLDRLDAVEAEIEVKRAEGKATKALENKAEKLALQWEQMDAERGQLLTIEDFDTEAADIPAQNLTKEQYKRIESFARTKKDFLAAETAKKLSEKVSRKNKKTNEMSGDAAGIEETADKKYRDIEAAVEGKPLVDVAKYLAESADRPEHRAVSQKILTRLMEMSDLGVDLEFKVAHLGDTVPSLLFSARGTSQYDWGGDRGKIIVYVNGADVTGKVGVNYETLTHELLHAATQAAIKIGNQKKAAGSDLGKAVSDLYALLNHLISSFNNKVAEVKKGNAAFTDFESDLYNRKAFALVSVDELVAYGMTNSETQKYLESIPYKKNSAFSEFVNIVRRLLGLPESSETALSEIIRITDSLLTADVGHIRDVGKQTGINFHKEDVTLSEDELNEYYRITRMTPPLSDKQVTVKGQVLEDISERGTKKALRSVNKAFREARTATKKDIKQIQKTLISAIKESGLDAKEQASFMNTIAGIQTTEQMQKQIPKIQARIENKINKRIRSQTIKKIRKTLSNVKKSKVIAIDYVKAIQGLFEDIDLQKRQEGTIAELRKTLDYISRNPDADMPKKLVKRLEILNKKRIEEISTQDLLNILDSMNQMIGLGKKTLEILKRKRELEKQQMLAELSEDTIPLSNRPLLGKGKIRNDNTAAMRVIEEVRNKIREARNKLDRFSLYKNPMDVIFDIMDGGKNYTGANYRVFKQQVDDAYGRYMDFHENVTAPVIELMKKYDLKEDQYRAIGAWAALQQENGREKLIATGYSKAEIDGLTLDKQEMEIYEAMREALDSMRPALREVLRVYYNQDLTEVDNYFPFLTDFDALKEKRIEDVFGNKAPELVVKKNVEKGFTYERTGDTKRPIRIDAAKIFFEHTSNAAYLIQAGPIIKDLADIAGSDQYLSMAGDLGQATVVDWLNLLARKGRWPGSNEKMDMLRKNVGAAMLGFKLSTIAVQPTALGDAAGLVGGDYVARGVTSFATSGEWRKFLFDNFPEVKFRVGNDLSYLDIGGDKFIDKLQEWGYVPIQKIDLFAASSTAIAAYTKYVESKGGKVDFSNPDPQAINYAQLMMRRTNSSSFAKDASPLISQGKFTGNVSLDRLMFQLQSFMLNRWSIIEHDMMRLGFRKGRTLSALNAALFLHLAIWAEMGIQWGSAAVISSMMGEEPEPIDEEMEKKVALAYVRQVPVVGQIASAFTYGGIPAPSASLLVKSLEEGGYALQAAFSDDPDMWKFSQHLAQFVLLSSGVWYGVPGTLQMSNIVRDLNKSDESGSADFDFDSFDLPEESFE